MHSHKFCIFLWLDKSKKTFNSCVHKYEIMFFETLLLKEKEILKLNPFLNQGENKTEV